MVADPTASETTFSLSCSKTTCKKQIPTLRNEKKTVIQADLLNVNVCV